MFIQVSGWLVCTGVQLLLFHVGPVVCVVVCMLVIWFRWCLKGFVGPWVQG